MLRAPCQWKGAVSKGHSERKGRRGACWARKGTRRGGAEREEVTQLRDRVWAFASDSPLYFLDCECAGALKTEEAFLVTASRQSLRLPTDLWAYFLEVF